MSPRTLPTFDRLVSVTSDNGLVQDCAGMFVLAVLLLTVVPVIVWGNTQTILGLVEIVEMLWQLLMLEAVDLVNYI